MSESVSDGDQTNPEQSISGVEFTRVEKPILQRSKTGKRKPRGPIYKMARVGGPMKLSKSIIAKFAKTLRTGCYIVTACKVCRISNEAKTLWCKIGRETIEKSITENETEVTEYQALCVKFLTTCETVEAEVEAEQVSGVIVGEQGWQGKAWFLERKHNDRWARKDHVTNEISGPGGKPIEQKLEVNQTIDPEHLRKYMREKYSADKQRAE